MSASTIITVVPVWTGSVDELVRTVRAAADIGASVVEVPDAAAVAALEAETDLVVRGPGGSVPVYEITDVGQLTDVPAGPAVHVDLRGLRSVPSLAAAMEALPAEATFTASGDGAAALPMMLAALAAGGHLRVPLTDSPRDNAQLVARAAGLARIAQRPPASPAEARTLLGVRT